VRVFQRLALLAAGALVVVVYLRSPIDLIPDYFGLPGLLDDLVVLGLAIAWLVRWRRMGDGPRVRGRAGRSDRARRSDPNASGSADDARAEDDGLGAGVWDPWRVLGIERGASREEVAQAYRRQVKLYHPDRVADLGEELQALAHRKALELRRAYEELSR
jgi:DnaJ domain/Protein of unknown function (DUF1232)